MSADNKTEETLKKDEDSQQSQDLQDSHHSQSNKSLGSDHENTLRKLAASISRTARGGGPRISKLFNDLADVSKMNYFLSRPNLGTSVSRFMHASSLTKSEESVLSVDGNVKENDKLEEKFPVNVTPLMNEENLWGCFYNFPELYADVYSPVQRVLELKDVAAIDKGVLTKDMVAACLSYLRRTPILGDYALIKLDLSSKSLSDIKVLQGYKYIVYLDLSSNLLEELTVLSHLLYLQHLSVASNNLTNVLAYDPPQWFLTEVHYKYNSVMKINDLSAFWSITVLDLSHNNIKYISGLYSLRYLRRLDLSFNHIQRLENLNELRLVWLDISYNNISTFEHDDQHGLWTLVHLEYLNLNENNLVSMKIFAGCGGLKELYVRNNSLGVLLEVAVYMQQMRRLIVLDLRGNPMCATPGFRDVVINTFPALLSLDAQELDPVEQRTLITDMFPEIVTHSTRRLLRLLYIRQLSRALVSPCVPPADTTDVPIVVIVGHEAVGKGKLVRRLAAECSSNTMLAREHTTAAYHYVDHFIEITREKYDEMLLAGDFLTYTERDGESYGLSREQACVKDGKVRVVSMDLTGALMLKLRGYRPYLILATMLDQRELAMRQSDRRRYRQEYYQRAVILEDPLEHETLQVIVSGRIVITGILNEIIMGLPEEKSKSEFRVDSSCSLMMDSETRKAHRDSVNKDALFDPSKYSIYNDQVQPEEVSMYSLYKESVAMDEYLSFIATDGQSSCLSKKGSSIKQHKSIDFSKFTSGTWKGHGSASKSVAFIENVDSKQDDPSGLVIDPQPQAPFKETDDKMHSISSRGPWPVPGHHAHGEGSLYLDDVDLWLAFLTEVGQMDASDIGLVQSNETPRRYDFVDSSMMNQMQNAKPVLSEAIDKLETIQTLTKTHTRESYESVNQRNPSLFWATVTMDNPDKAFKQVRDIIKNIVKSQKSLEPMFDIDFANLSDYPTVEKRLDSIRQQIAPHQLFY